MFVSTKPFLSIAFCLCLGLTCFFGCVMSDDEDGDGNFAHGTDVWVDDDDSDDEPQSADIHADDSDVKDHAEDSQVSNQESAKRITFPNGDTLPYAETSFALHPNGDSPEEIQHWRNLMVQDPVWRAATKNTVAGAIAWASDQGVGDNHDECNNDVWTNYCWRFVRQCYLTPPNFASAIEAWNSSVGVLGSKHYDSNPPAGALVFFNLSSYGHVGLAVGDGTMWHAWSSGGFVTTILAIMVAIWVGDGQIR